MRLIIRGRSVPISSLLRDFCTHRVMRALQPFSEHVRSAEVVLEDVNGPRGGLGQACRLSVGLADGGMLIVQSLESDFYAASGQAAGRVGHLVRRELGRIRTRRRRGPRDVPSRDALAL